MRGSNHERMEGILPGVIGGLAGLVAMSLYFRALQALVGSGAGADGEGQEGPIERDHALDDIALFGQQSREDEGSTETVGRLAYEAVRGEEPEEETRERLGQLVHWGYGVFLGGIYGALRPRAEGPDLLGGLGFGTAAWVVGDELMVPLLGLSEGPTSHPWQDHATALGAHLVYGAATSVATRALRRVL